MLEYTETPSYKGAKKTNFHAQPSLSGKPNNDVLAQKVTHFPHPHPPPPPLNLCQAEPMQEGWRFSTVSLA